MGLFCIAIGIPFMATSLWAGNLDVPMEKLSQVDTGIKIHMELQGQYVILDAEEYLAGVIAANMEPSTELELWRTMAIVERTNLYRILGGRNQVDARDLPFTYLAKEEREAMWEGFRGKEYEELLQQGILGTKKQVLTYHGEPIEALYHQVSPGMTVSALETYGKDLPYLAEVDSSMDVEAIDYMDIRYVDRIEEQCITVLESTSRGYVKRIQVGEEEMNNEEFRQEMSLPSSIFYVEELGEQYRIVSLGKGHGMGLSLHGGAILAKEQQSAEAILAHYYPGTTIMTSGPGELSVQGGE